MEYKMHENYRNKNEKLTLTLKTDEIQKTLIKETYKHVLRRPASTMKTDYWRQNKYNLKLSTNMANTFYMFAIARSWA